MSHFSRLTDIVTCNLSKILAEAEHPAAVLDEVITEMREGLTGARRSVATASENERRLEREVLEHQSQVAAWRDKAKQHLANSAEADARRALVRKSEVEDLIGGLVQQHHQAVQTRDHLATMYRALEARLSEALRRREELGLKSETHAEAATESANPSERDLAVERELKALREELGS